MVNLFHTMDIKAIQVYGNSIGDGSKCYDSCLILVMSLAAKLYFWVDLNAMKETLSCVLVCLLSFF